MGLIYPMNQDIASGFFRKIFIVLGILAAAGLVGYGLAYLIRMPQISPGGLVPTTFENNAETSPKFGSILAVFILLYAFPILPVTVMFTIKQYHIHAHALVLACCLMGISTIIEIINNLPVAAQLIYPGKLQSVSGDVLLYLKQAETIKYLSMDVAGFSLIYAALLIYAIVFFRSHRWLSYTILASIVLFLANVPCLWFAPNMAIILMALSIFAMAPVPIFLAKISGDS